MPSVNYGVFLEFLNSHFESVCPIPIGFETLELILSHLKVGKVHILHKIPTYLTCKCLQHKVPYSTT